MAIDPVTGPPPAFTITATPVRGATQAVDGALSIHQAGARTPSDKW
jgi:type IV pilus assembly protein PilE